MYGKAICSMFLLLALALGGSVCRGQENRIVNGEFDAGIESWRMSEGDGFAAGMVHTDELSGPHLLKIDVFNSSAQEAIMVSQSGLTLKQGAPYHLSFAAKAQDCRQIGVLVEEEGDEVWVKAWRKYIDLTPKAKTFAFEFIHKWADAENATLHFVLRHPFFPLAGEDENIDVYVDTVSLVQEPPADPNLAHYPLPPDGAIHESTWAAPSWTPGRYAASHDVYFGKDFNDVNDGADDAFWGNQNYTYFAVGFPEYANADGLMPGTTYYWRIDEVNELHPDSPWEGDVWSFTIPPTTAYDPVPADGNNLVDPNVTLSWAGGFGAQRHTVYFGDNFDDVNAATEGIEQQGTTYNAGPLELGKAYYWRVDEFDGWFTHKGPVWSFTTVPLKASNPDPPDGAMHENLWAILSWSPGYFAESHDVYISRNLDDVNAGADDAFFGNLTWACLPVGFPDFTGWSIGLMEPGATIYWRVDEVNNLHPGSPWKGDVWNFTIQPQP